MTCPNCNSPIKRGEKKYRIHRVTNKMHKEAFICGTCYWVRQNDIIKEKARSKINNLTK